MEGTGKNLEDCREAAPTNPENLLYPHKKKKSFRGSKFPSERGSEKGEIGANGPPQLTDKEKEGTGQQRREIRIGKRPPPAQARGQ